MIKLKALSDIPAHLPTIPQAAMEFLRTADADTPCGRYDLGEDCYINVMTLTTDPALAAAEAHEVYTDVQILLSGEEAILYGDRTHLSPSVPYNAEIEAAFYPCDGFARVTYRAGEAIVLFPADAHLPGRAVTEPMTVKKAIVKLRYTAQ